MKKLFAGLSLLALTSSSALAHHSDAGIDPDTIVTLEGTVKAFKWRQPHVYLGLEVQKDGQTVDWDIQLVAVNVLARSGWTSKSLEPGDEVFIRVNPAEDGRSYGKMSSIEFTDGSPVAVKKGETAGPTSKATSLDGQWLSDRTRSGPKYPVGFYGFFREQLKLTDAAISAAAAYDPLSPDNPESTCIGRPTPAAIVSSIGYMMRFDLSDMEEKIIIQSEWYNEIRTVHMDGREHPDASQTFATGHSIGRWDGDTLVIGTRNFDPHVSPYQIGVPSGLKKHVVETYRVIEDGASLEMTFTLDDPEFLLEPLEHSRIMTYTPQLTMYASDCDPESTSQFLK